MRFILAALLALNLLSACAAPAGPDTSAQAVLTLEGDYVSTARLVRDYIRSADPDQPRVATLKRLDDEAYAALRDVRAQAQGRQPVDAGRLARAQAAVLDMDRVLAQPR